MRRTERGGSRWQMLLAVALLAGALVPGALPAADGEMVVGIWTSPESDALKKIAPHFTQKTGIRIVIDEIARDAYRSKVSAAMFSRAPTWDVVWSNGEWIPEFAKAGALELLDGVLARHELANLGSLDTTTFEGKLWALPTENHPHYLWYRPSLLKAAGAEVPQTWDEFLAALKRLQKVDPTGKVERYGTVIRTSVGGIHFEFTTYFLGFGAEWLDASNRPVMNSPQGIAALNYFLDLVRQKLAPPDSDAIGFLEKNQYFQAERAAIMIHSAAAYEALTSCEKSPKICRDVAITLVPGRREGTAIKRGSVTTPNGWIIPASSTRKDPARQFIKYLASQEGAALWAVNGGSPSNKKVYADAEVLKVRKDFPLMGQTMPYTKVPPLVPQTPQLMQVWTRELNLAANFRKSPEAALTEIAAEWTRILREAGYLR